MGSTDVCIHVKGAMTGRAQREWRSTYLKGRLEEEAGRPKKKRTGRKSPPEGQYSQAGWWGRVARRGWDCLIRVEWTG